MIKKLVRYGNSNALVIDRAILELLNIGEGSMVKMSTDGKSLIITPETTASTALSTNDIADQMGMTMADRLKKTMEPFLSQAANNPEQMQATMELYSNPEVMKEKMAAIKIILRKYAADQAKMMTPEALDAIAAIQEKHKDNMNSPAYVQEMTDLTYQIAPNLKNMHAEIDELNKKNTLTLTETPMTEYTK